LADFESRVAAVGTLVRRPAHSHCDAMLIVLTSYTKNLSRGFVPFELAASGSSCLNPFKQKTVGSVRQDIF
jgi:hypothetical protein